MEYKTYDEVLSAMIVSKIFNENTSYNDFQKKLILNEIQTRSPFTLDSITREKFFEYSKKNELSEDEKTFLCNHFKKFFDFKKYKPILFTELKQAYKSYAQCNTN